jgi:hypothetical protein
MKRIDVFKELKKRVEEQGITRHAYKSDNSGKCQYCAVGHLMEVCNFDMALLDKADGPSEDNFTFNVKSIAYVDGSMDLSPIYQSGVTFDELRQLQDINDNRPPHEVIEFIDLLIEEEERLNELTSGEG